MTTVLLVVLLLSAVAAVKVGDIDGRETVHDDPLVAYPYHLMSTSAFGRVRDDVLPGSRVPVDNSLTRFQTSVTGDFLELRLTRNGRYSQCYNMTGDNSIRPYDVTGEQSLVGGLKIDFSGEQGNVASVNEDLAFAVDEDNYVVVGHPHRFYKVDVIEFWVVAICQVPGTLDRVESNPLAFIVMIDHPGSGRAGAAVYAGVIVLVVCFFAVLIPLTVRTKRRMREGKLVCACGSSTKKLEKNNKRKAMMNGSGTNNGGVPAVTSDTLSVIYEGRPPAEPDARRGHETIQSKRMRTVSEHHFQPRWLDPHYKEVYVHPNYKPPTPQQLKVPSPTPPPQLKVPSPTPFSTTLSKQVSKDPAAATASATAAAATASASPTADDVTAEKRASVSSVSVITTATVSRPSTSKSASVSAVSGSGAVHVKM